MLIEHNQKTYQTKVLFTEQSIKERVWAISGQINRDYADCGSLVVLIVLNGAILFGSDLIRFLSLPTEIESIRLRSYHGTASSGKVEVLSQVPALAGRHVLVVEDIVDSGRSLELLKSVIKEQSPASLRTVSLLDKPTCHENASKPDYVGFEIGPEFVVGYGLDLDGKYRNLPYIVSLHPVEQG